MLRKILLPTLLLILAYGFWISPDFKLISSGVAIFLFGMLSLEEGFNAFSGGAMERLLRRVTSNRWKSLGFGLLSTALMQSSSLVSVITISFVSAGLLTLAAGIGIIFGANLGTTTGAWLIAGFGLKVKIATYAMPLLVFGIVLIFQSSKKLKGIGYILSGLGFLFLGIHYMKEGFEAFGHTIDLARFAVAGYPGVFLFALVGVFATVVMQSSHATLVLVITALAAQQITYENALALAIGANTGTTITAILGSLSANLSGKRLAVAHLIFNTVTGLISISFIYQLVDLVDWISTNLGISETNYTLKLAVFHSVFNLLGVLIMLPFINPLVSMLETVFPEKLPEVDQPKYLSNASAEFPETAVEAVHNETRRVYDSAVTIIINGLGIKQSKAGLSFHTGVTKEEVLHFQVIDIDEHYEKHIKPLYSAIVAFISETNFPRRAEESTSLQWLREANTRIVEAIKGTKHLQKNFHLYVGSTNVAISGAYSEVRAHIAGIIRELEEMRHEDEGVLDMLALDALKLMIDEDQDRMTNKITSLIGTRNISPQRGSSLLNDSAYAHGISMNLVLAAETLFGAGERNMLHAAKVMSLDESERAEVSEHISSSQSRVL